jgi:hypothetical protein
MDYAGSTEAEVGAARKWLAKRGAEVAKPTTLRRGARGGASAVITFGGGAVLAVAMSVTTSKPAWALSRLGLLALGAVVVVTQAIGFSTQYWRRKLPAGDYGTLAVAR